MTRFRSVRPSPFILLVAAGLTAFTAAARAQQPAAAPPAAGLLAADKYKNIQVLKDVPAEDIEATMHFIEAATGLRCVDCHVQENGQFVFDKDDKRDKTTAREMIKIVRGVNEQFFKGEMRVSCETCHRGGRPMSQPALAALLTPEQVAAMSQAAARRGQPPAGGGRGAAGPRGAGGRAGPPDVPIDDVLDKYIAALGGQPALAKLQSLVLSGTLTNRAGERQPFTIEEKPGRYRETVQGQPVVTHGFDGTSGWLQTGERLQNIGEFRLAEALRISSLGLPLSIRERYHGLHGVRPPQIDGKPTIAMAGDISRTVTETLIFDPATGLLLRRIIVTKTPVGNLSEEVNYKDYREIAGVKLPFVIERKTWEVNDTLTVAEARPNAPIDDGRFARPKG